MGVSALFPKQVRLELSLFPFKVYLVLAPVALFICGRVTWTERVRDALAEGAERIVLGYVLCVIAFFVAAVVCFIIRLRERVAENLMFAGISFIILYFLAPLAGLS
jgi:hypothetical protein